MRTFERCNNALKIQAIQEQLHASGCVPQQL